MEKRRKKQANNLATGTRLMMTSGTSRDVAEETGDIAGTQRKVNPIQKKPEPKGYMLSLSYGKDSLACLGAIEQLG